MKYEILNVSPPDASGALGPAWALFSIDDKDPAAPIIKKLFQVSSGSSDAGKQLETVYGLAQEIVKLDPDVKISDAIITGEYLALSDGKVSVVKRAVFDLINQA